MKNKNKCCKKCKNDDVIEKKVNTTKNGKEYFEEVEKNQDNNDSSNEKIKNNEGNQE